MEFSELAGYRIIGISGAIADSERITIRLNKGGFERVVEMYHDQNCCESVYVESVVGSPEKMVGQEIVRAVEATNREAPRLSKYDDSFTWTYYTLFGEDSSLTIRWYGTSNGYYSESVELRDK